MSTLEKNFFRAADAGDLETIKAAIAAGQNIDAIEPWSGLTAYHYAVGRNHLEVAKYLVAQGASCTPDRQGRWPSTIAALCEVSGEMCDFVTDQEEKWDVLGPRP